MAWINADSHKNFNNFLGYSISNVLQLNVFSAGLSKDVAQDINIARFHASDEAWNWRIGAKAVAFSPLRGAPFWGGGHISMGRSVDKANARSTTYLFGETMATLELTKNLAINLNPKIASSGAGNLWGLGLGANIQLSPKLEIIPEANFVISQISQSNATLGVRWHATEKLSVDAYASTAASLLGTGQLINAGKARAGIRLMLSLSLIHISEPTRPY